MAIYRPTTVTVPAGLTVLNQDLILDSDDGTAGTINAGSNQSGWVSVAGWEGAAPVVATLRARARVVGTMFRNPEIYIGGILLRALVTPHEGGFATTFQWRSVDLGTVVPSQVEVRWPAEASVVRTQGWQIASVLLEYTPPAITLSATGDRTQTGAVALTAPAVMAAAGGRLLAAGASLVAGSRIAAVGARVVAGDAMLSVPSLSISAVGGRVMSGTVALVAPARIAAAGARTIEASACLSAPSLLVASGGRVMGGSASLQMGGYYVNNPALQGRKIARDIQIPFQGEKVS